MTTESFISFIEALGSCWMQSRFEDLNAFLAEDAVVVAPGGKPRIEGIAPAIDSYRQFVSHAQVAAGVTYWCWPAAMRTGVSYGAPRFPLRNDRLRGRQEEFLDPLIQPEESNLLTG